MEHVLPVLLLSLGCAAWVLVQRFVARHDPGQPGVEGRAPCGGPCGHREDRDPHACGGCQPPT